MSLRYWRHLPDLLLLIAALTTQLAAVFWMLSGPMSASSPVSRRALKLATAVSIIWLIQGFLLGFLPIQTLVPREYWLWARGSAIAWTMVSMGMIAVMIFTAWLPRPQRDHSPARRKFLTTVQASLFASPAIALGYGVFIERSRLRLREVDLHIPRLPKQLDGFKIVQLTDIHLSPFLSERELAKAVDLANETRAHLAVITGDLISSAGDPLEACVAQLGRLKAEAGVLGCLGNHEIYADAEEVTTVLGKRVGIQFLRGEARGFKLGGERVNIAGVDYQRFGMPYLEGVEKLRDPEALNILLSHNPDVFPVAAAKGFHVTLAGHTHGGQVKVEILRQELNVARIFTRFIDGEYRAGDAALFVSRGIGTIGVPLRLGAPPEVALVRLCAT
jgi:predicted MPP superfamily phosphohydrolase